MKISIILEALTGTFETDMKRAGKAADKAAKEAQEAWSRAGVVIGAGIVAAVSALTILTKKSIDTAGALFEMSQKVGVSVESLSTLKFAAEQSGVGVDQLQSAMVKLAKNASDASQGIGTAVNGFDALGISVKNADGSLKDTDVLMRELATQFAKYEDGANKTALAVNIFGKAGAELIPLLNEGAEGIGELEQRARDLGLELSTKTAQAAEQFGDNLDQLKSLATGLGNDLAAQLLPSLNSLSERLIDGGIESRKAGEGMDVFANAMKGTLAFAIVLKNGVEGLTNVIAANVDVAVAAAKAGIELGGMMNPVQSAWKAAHGELRSFNEILDEFKTTSAKAAAVGADGLQASITDVADAFEDLWPTLESTSVAVKKTGKNAAGAAPGIVNLAGAAANAAKAAKAAEKELAKLWKLNDQAVARTLEMVEALELEDQALAELQARFAEQEKDLQDEIRMLGLSGAAREQAAIAMEAERMARDKNGVAIEKERKKYEELLKTLAKAQKIDSILGQFENQSGLLNLVSDIELVKEALEDAFDPKVVERLQGALGQMNAQLAGDMVASFGALLGAAQTFTKEGSSGFKAMEKGMAALSIIQDVLALKAAVNAVLTQGGGEPYTAFARMAAMAAAVAPMLASIGVTIGGFGGGSSGGPSAADRQQAQGTGSVLGDSDAKSESILNAIEITADATSQLVGINRSMLTALQTMQAAIGGASSLLARGAGGTAPTALSTGASNPLPSIAGGASLFTAAFANIFGGKESLRDQGIQIVGGTLSEMIDDIMVQSYATIHRSGGWFSSSRNYDRTADLGDEIAVQFQLVLESMADAVRSGAEALGLNMAEVNAAIAAYQIEEIRISTMDLSAEEAQAELEAVFSSIFDGLAGAVVPFIAQFQQVGEGLGETLIRVATGVQVTQEAVLQLGFALDETDPERFAQISEGLISMVGGIDEFISGMQTFVNNFAPEAHRFMVAQDELNRAFAQAGLTLPETESGMWALMQTLDATTESGAEQIATLLRLAGVADSYYSMLEARGSAAAEAEEAAAEAAREASEFIGELVSELQGHLESGQQAIDEFDMSPLAVELAQIQRETQAALAAAIANGAGDMIQMTIAMTGMERSIIATRLAALDFTQQFEEWTFEDALTGMTELERSLAENDRTWQQRYSQALEIFGEGSAEAIAVLDLWDNATDRVRSSATEAAHATNSLADSLVSYVAGMHAAQQTVADILREATIGVRGDGMTEQQRAIDEINRRFAGFSSALRGTLNDPALNPAQRLMLQAQVNEGLIQLDELRLEALFNLELEWQGRIASEVARRYEGEMEWLRRLGQFQESLMLDPELSTLTPQEMLTEAQRQYDLVKAQLAAAALTEGTEDDEIARDQFEAAARALLQQGRSFWSSGQEFDDLFALINGDIDMMEAAAQAAANAALSTASSGATTNETLTGLRVDQEEQTEAIVERLVAIETESRESRELLRNVVVELKRLNRPAVTR